MLAPSNLNDSVIHYIKVTDEVSYLCTNDMEWKCQKSLNVRLMKSKKRENRIGLQKRILG